MGNLCVMKVRMLWQDGLIFAKCLNEVYGARLILDSDEDDNVVYCPECGGEPIYEEDFPEIEQDEDGKYICPVCEETFEW